MRANQRQARLADEEASLVRRAQELEAREQATRARAGFVANLRARAGELKAERQRVRGERLRKLEIVAGRSKTALVEEYVERAKRTAEAELAAEQRDHEARLTQDCLALARRLVAIAAERLDGTSPHTRSAPHASIVSVPLAQALNPGGPAHRAFEQGTGAQLEVDPENGQLSAHAQAPPSREAAERLLRLLVGLGAPEPDQVTRAAEQVRAQLARELSRSAAQAAQTLDLEALPETVAELVGRLSLRQSYAQNQLHHAIEVGHLAGLLAAELGLEPALARRGGLLHDLGKALTPQVSGAHALLGAEVARQAGEDERVCNAIASHHHDVAPSHALSLVVTAADAMSGGRPGARRAGEAHFSAHVRKVQELARAFPEIARVEVMNAGREVRAYVAGLDLETSPGQVHQGLPVLEDGQLPPLAERLARTFASELAFSGQLVVTVIRESRVVATAR